MKWAISSVIVSMLSLSVLAIPEPSPPDMEFTGYKSQLGPCEIGRAINIVGRGTNGNDLVGPIVVFEGDGADGFVINGRNAPYQATGGTIENLRICRKKGTNGGRAVLITAIDSAQRVGEISCRRLKIFPEAALAGGTPGNWADGLVVDGSMLTTSGSAGIRRVTLDDVRVAGATGRSIFLHNAVHCCMRDVQVDPGGVALATFEIRDGQNIQGSNLIVHGDLVLSGSPVEVTLQGRFHTIRLGAGCRAVTIHGTAHFVYIDKGASGLFCGHISEGLRNDSMDFKVIR